MLGERLAHTDLRVLDQRAEDVLGDLALGRSQLLPVELGRELGSHLGPRLG